MVILTAQKKANHISEMPELGGIVNYCTYCKTVKNIHVKIGWHTNAAKYFKDQRQPSNRPLLLSCFVGHPVFIKLEDLGKGGGELLP